MTLVFALASKENKVNYNKMKSYRIKFVHH